MREWKAWRHGVDDPFPLKAKEDLLNLQPRQLPPGGRAVLKRWEGPIPMVVQFFQKVQEERGLTSIHKGPHRVQHVNKAIRIMNSFRDHFRRLLDDQIKKQKQKSLRGIKDHTNGWHKDCDEYAAGLKQLTEGFQEKVGRRVRALLDNATELEEMEEERNDAADASGEPSSKRCRA
jgi:hypothetical protein